MTESVWKWSGFINFVSKGCTDEAVKRKIFYLPTSKFNHKPSYMSNKKLSLIPIALLLFAAACSTNKNMSSENSLPITRTSFFPKSRTLKKPLPNPDNTYVFLMAGQSNMAGRGQVMPVDTIEDPRILTLNNSGEVEIAKEPLHFYEPELQGLDCGLSFAKALIEKLPKGSSILLVPMAVGGSSTKDWLGDDVYRGVRLLSNFTNRVEKAQKLGKIKGLLWHQGESDANEAAILLYEDKIKSLFNILRSKANDEDMPIVMGELGDFGHKDDATWKLLNALMHRLETSEKNIRVVSSGGLNHKGDNLHFDSEGQRTMGKRYADAYLTHFYSKSNGQ